MHSSAPGTHRAKGQQSLSRAGKPKAQETPVIGDPATATFHAVRRRRFPSNACRERLGGKNANMRCLQKADCSRLLARDQSALDIEGNAMRSRVARANETLRRARPWAAAGPVRAPNEFCAAGDYRTAPKKT